VHKSLLKLLGFVVALALSASASALGLGGINVVSALGQPLKADIELVSVGKAERASLIARLASTDAYKGAGLEYPYGNKFKFQMEHRADGNSYLVVTSAQPVNDPFVSLLVELTWSSGRLLREYTFLLDPPDYFAEQPAPAEVVVVAPAVPAAPVEIVEPAAEQESQDQQEWLEDAKQQAETMRAEAPGDEKALASQPSAAPAPAPKPVAKAEPAGEVVVKSGDTLNKIAIMNKPVDVSLERMLVALYRANAEQFDGKNMNRIRAGKILRMPEQSELMDVAQAEAVREIRAQVADWNAYRQKLASAAPESSQSQDAQQVASGKISSTVADKAPVAKESAREVLKLSKGEAPGDQTAAGGGKAMTAQDRKNAEQEEAIANAKAMEEEQTRLAMLEQNLKDMQRLAELKSQAAALTAASEVAAASEVKPAPVVKPQPKAVEPEPTLVDEILGEPLYLAGGAAVLIALGGLGYLAQRRRKSPAAAFSEKQEEMGEITGRMAMPQAPSPDTGDFTVLAAKDETESAQSDDVDPISEADLFLNFGRDAQAEEVLKEALLRTPDDHRIHLKLLGIYANRVDVNSFATIARQLQDSGDEPAWEQAAAMGRKLEPGNPMYGGASIEDAASATMQTMVLTQPPEIVPEAASPEVDFDLGAGAEETTTPGQEENQPEQEMVMDFDLTATHPSQAAPEMDFDITSTSPSMAAMESEAEVEVELTPEPEIAVEVPEEPAESGLPNLDDLVFDVTSPEPEVEPEEPKKVELDDADVMEFSLDFPVEEEEVKPAAPAADIGLSGISLNLDDAGTTVPGVEEVKDERWHEVATKLDLARAYQEMGDQTGAREILEEVLRDGDAEQQEAAQALIDQLI
jgi:pilus assembly protein FimV